MVIASKGLSLNGARPSELLIGAGADSDRLAVLSGPNLAGEIAIGKPAAAILAGPTLLVESLRTRLVRPTLRLYLTDDVVGVEISGALKNVIAIAVSGIRALGYGENAAAALLSRGVAEMARLAEACGGRTETACGLAGVGDLVVTSSNTGSRNAKFGALLASGMSVQSAVDKIGATVEGIGTAHGALQLAAAYKLEMPITAAVVAAISGGTSIEALARALLGRSPAGEWR
jgi:glycerol-3-phosphate dehydrogenase (NAD(P)+)